MSSRAPSRHDLGLWVLLPPTHPNLPGTLLAGTLLAPYSSFPLGVGERRTPSTTTFFRRGSCNFGPLCTQIASEASADAIVTPLSCFPSALLSLGTGESARACAMCMYRRRERRSHRGRSEECIAGRRDAVGNFETNEALGLRCFIGFGVVISGAGIRPQPRWRVTFNGNE